MASFEIGDLISFTYPAIHQQGTRAHDKYPQVLVLHNNWQNNVHGLNFNYLTDDEINVIRMMIDPSFQLKYVEDLERKNPNLVKEFDRIIGRAGAATITSPFDFYNRVVKPFIKQRGWDPYRRYRPDKMTNVRTVQKQRVMTGEERRRLFGVEPRSGGRSEKEIMRDLAIKDVENKANPQEKRFITRLQGDALDLFNRYKKAFQFAKGPRLPTFRR